MVIPERLGSHLTSVLAPSHCDDALYVYNDKVIIDQLSGEFFLPSNDTPN